MSGAKNFCKNVFAGLDTGFGAWYYFLAVPRECVVSSAFLSRSKNSLRANSSVVERLPYKQVVGGSNPSSPIAAQNAVCVEE